MNLILFVRRLFAEGVLEVLVDFRGGRAHQVRWRVPGRDEMRTRVIAEAA